MEKINYGIISYHRPECKTLKLLKQIGVPTERIIIALNDPKDYEKYNELYGKEVKIVVKKGDNVACNRNNVLNAFAENEKIVLLDDDILSINKYIPDGKYGKLQKITSLDELETELEECFKKTKRVGSIFGVYPVSNTLNITSAVRSDGKYSINKNFQGGLIGFINKKEVRYNEDYALLEDYELLLRNMKRGFKNVRRNDLTVIKEKNTKTAGGCYDLYKQGKLKTYLIKLKLDFPFMIDIKKDYSGIRYKRR